MTSPGPVGDDDAARLEVDLGHERGDERHEGVAAVGRTHGQQVLRGAVDDRLHLAQVRAVDVDDGQPDELVVVVLVGVLGLLVPAEGGVEEGAARRPRPRCGRRAPRR